MLQLWLVPLSWFPPARRFLLFFRISIFSSWFLWVALQASFLLKSPADNTILCYYLTRSTCVLLSALPWCPFSLSNIFWFWMEFAIVYRSYFVLVILWLRCYKRKNSSDGEMRKCRREFRKRGCWGRNGIMTEWNRVDRNSKRCNIQ